MLLHELLRARKRLENVADPNLETAANELSMSNPLSLLFLALSPLPPPRPRRR